MYKVSADTSEKEKAVGGIMTFGQAGWLVLGFLIFAWLVSAPGKYQGARRVGGNSLAATWCGVRLYFRILQKGRTPLSHISALSAQFQAKV